MNTDPLGKVCIQLFYFQLFSLGMATGLEGKFWIQICLDLEGDGFHQAISSQYMVHELCLHGQTMLQDES